MRRGCMTGAVKKCEYGGGIRAYLLDNGRVESRAKETATFRRHPDANKIDERTEEQAHVAQSR